MLVRIFRLIFVSCAHVIVKIDFCVFCFVCFFVFIWVVVVFVDGNSYGLWV